MKKYMPYVRSVIFLAGLVVIFQVCNFLFDTHIYEKMVLEEVVDSGCDTVVLGASHGECSVDPEVLDERINTKSFNLAISGQSVKDSYYYLLEADRTNDIRQVILEVDFQYYYNGNLANEMYEPFLFENISKTSYVYWKYINDNSSSLDVRNVFTNRCRYNISPKAVKNNVKLKTGRDYANKNISEVLKSNPFFKYKKKGVVFRNLQPDGPCGMVEYARLKGIEKNGINKTVKKYIRLLIKYCKENDIKLMCITAPVAPGGVKAVNSEEISKDMKRLFNESLVEYYDGNLLRFDVLPRADKQYLDYEGHMGEELAGDFSKVLSDIISDVNNGCFDENKYFYGSYEEMFENMEAGGAL